MYLDRIDISNLRTLDELSVNLRFPGGSRCESDPLLFPNINLLLGNNGAGKSTLLRGIALSLLSPIIESSGYVPVSMVRRSGKNDYAERASARAFVQLHHQDFGGAKKAKADERHELAVEIQRRHSTEILQSRHNDEDPSLWDAIYDDRSPAFLLVGYGATRRVEDSGNYDSSVRGKSRHLRYQRVASLFEDGVSLTPLSSWLPDLKKSNKGRYTQVVHMIDRLLPAPFSFDGTFEDGDFSFHQDGNPVAFPALSDGYKAYLGWITDLLFHVCMGCPKGKKLIENRGVVLVDEIDLHLHPGWQRTVVPVISKCLPNLQFILTSHSPLVTGSLESGNIFVLEHQGNGAVTARQLEERVHGMTSEQILLSSYFELGSTRASTVTEEIATMIGKASGRDGKAALKALKKLAASGDAGPAKRSSRRRGKRPSIPSTAARKKAAKKKAARKKAVKKKRS